MKKIVYSIGIVSAMLLTACSSDNNSTSAEVADTNTTGTTTEATESGMAGTSMEDGTTMDGTTMGTGTSDATMDQAHRQHAQMIADEIARDLQLDDQTATEVSRIYYERNRQIGTLDQGTSFSATERMGGQTNETSDATTQDRTSARDQGVVRSGSNTAAGTSVGTSSGGNTQMQTGTTDRTTIDQTTDRELKALLTPEQYRRYEQNRTRYNSMQFNNTDGTMNNGTNSNLNNNSNTNQNNLNNQNRNNTNRTGTGTTGNGTNIQ